MTVVKPPPGPADSLELARLPPVSGQAFRDCIARLPMGVHVVTTAGPHGPGGFTATAVASVSDDPPTVLVCLNRKSPQTAVFRDNGCFAVNLMPAGSRDIADVFAGRGGDAVSERFRHGAWTTVVTGAPALVGAVTTLDCRLLEAREVGTHTVFFGTVVGTASSPSTAKDAPEVLIYRDRHYAEV